MCIQQGMEYNWTGFFAFKVLIEKAITASDYVTHFLFLDLSKVLIEIGVDQTAFIDCDRHAHVSSSNKFGMLFHIDILWSSHNYDEVEYIKAYILYQAREYTSRVVYM